MPVIFTLGHSNHPFSVFNSFLKKNGVNLVVDVRSIPYSRFNPQYRKKELEKALKEEGIGYLFLGRELGGKKQNKNDTVDYGFIRKSDFFRDGIDRLEKEMLKGFSPALICAEKDPLRCHRFFLITPALLKKGWKVMHILQDGTAISHAEGEEILLKKLKPPSLFSGAKEVLKKAYRQGTNLKN